MTAAALHRIVIVGGGIAGLAAAFQLQGDAPEHEIVLLERADRLGGKILTDRVDGFTIEAGPDSFLSTKPQAVELAWELGIENRLQGVNLDTRRTYVMRDGRLHELPEGLSGLVPGRLGPLFRSDLLSWPGKLRVVAEYVIPASRAEGDETLGAFMRRRMGQEVYERLVEPLMAGIYGGNGDELSLAATFPQLREMERAHGSVLRGMRANRRAAGPPRSPFLTPIGGVGEIVEALTARLDRVQLRCGVEAREVRVGPNGFAVQAGDEELEAGAVILATPAYVTADLVDCVDPVLAKTLRAIPYASSATVSLGFPQRALPRPLQGHGYLVPRREGRPVLACTWSSTKFQHRAPAGHVLIRVFFGRAGQEEALNRTDEELLGLACAELRAVLGISAQPEVARVHRWPRAMPQYTTEHLARLQTIEGRLEGLPGLALAGSAYRGVGIPDCIRSGQDAARAVHVQLTGAPSHTP